MLKPKATERIPAIKFAGNFFYKKLAKITKKALQIDREVVL